MSRDVVQPIAGVRRSWRAVGVGLLIVFAVGTAALGQDGAGQDVRRAGELMKNRQYRDAIRVLAEGVKGKGDDAVAKQHLMLGECHYLLKEYEPAREFFVKAARNATAEADKAVAEYRLACAAFRLGDMKAAESRIDAFLAARGNDARAGVLLTFKMTILAGQRKAAEGEIAKVHERIVADARKYGAATTMEADSLLSNFYRETGQEDKALGLYTRIATNYRRMIAELEKDKQPIPAEYEAGHDNAVLQLGAIYLEKKNFSEATKWLENVRYDPEQKVRARLLLAKMAYQKGDYAAAVAYLNEKNFLANVPEGPTKSDAYLIMGLAEKGKPNGDAGKIEEYLKKVGEDARGFAQAQNALGDIYREKGVGEAAIRAYKNVLASPDYAANGLYWTAVLRLEQAEHDTFDRSKAETIANAARMLAEVRQKYPLSAQAKLAAEKLTGLAQKGVDVGPAGADDMLKNWLATAKAKPGTAEAAQALVQVIRARAKALIDEKTKKVSKGPDYAGVAAAGDLLLDEKVYKGEDVGEAAWKGMRAEALYQRAVAELASLSPSKELEAAGAVYMKSPNAERAIEWLRQAQKLVDTKQLEQVKGIELALLEGLFKSEKAENKELAEKRFAELEADYGNDPRFAKLSIDLAEFYRAKGRLAEAADQYAGVARRGRDLSGDDAMKLWFAAGGLYSRAAYEAQLKADQRDYGVYVFPKETIRLDEDDVLRSDARFGREVAIRWPRGGRDVTAGEALVALSKASGVPFAWPKAKGKETITAYLDEKRLTLADGKYTVAAAMGMVLDLKTHKLAPDIGLADGGPTIAKPKDADEPGGTPWQLIEIYDARQEAKRYWPLTKNYGAWRTVHGGTSSAKGRDAGVLLYDVLQRVEQLSGARVLWAEGVDKQAKLGIELKEKDLPGFSVGADQPCAAVLAAVLEKADLRFKVVRRDLAIKFYEEANKAYNESRKLDPTGKYAEKSLFAVAVNYANLREYGRMKEVLKTYLKLFDNPNNESYQQACYWIAWAFENEKKHKEATNYYARAAEERLVIVKKDPAATGGKDDLKTRLSYDTQFALAQPLAGAFGELTLSQFADYVQVNTHVGVRIDAGVDAGAVRINRSPFKGVQGLDLLASTLEPLGLALKVENVNAEQAEKAYYRLALVYRKDGMDTQALENCTLLLARYPGTAQRRAVTRLMLDVYKGLMRYGRAFALLDELKKSATTDAERAALELETPGLHFDVADYEKAAAAYDSAQKVARDGAERVVLREGRARALMRAGKKTEALAEYEGLLKDDAAAEGAGGFVDAMSAFWLRYATGKATEREFPEDQMKYVLAYERMSDGDRAALGTGTMVRVTWIYYVLGLIDLDKGRAAEALVKLNAATASPDEALAGEAGLTIGLIHLRRNELAEARDALSATLFRTRSSESIVRGNYWLGACFAKLGDVNKAAVRFNSIIENYPASPYAEKARAALASRAEAQKP